MYYTIDGNFVNKNENKLIEGFDEEFVLKSIDNDEYVKSFLPGPFGGIDLTENISDAMLLKQNTYRVNGASASVLEDLNSSILIVKDSKLNIYMDENYPSMSESEKFKFLVKLKRNETNIQIVNPKIITTTGIEDYIAIPYNETVQPIENNNECPDNHICIPSNEWESLNLRDVLLDQLPGISYGTTNTDTTMES